MYPFTIFCKFIKLEILRPNFAKKMSGKNFDKINMKTKISIKFLHQGPNLTKKHMNEKNFEKNRQQNHNMDSYSNVLLSRISVNLEK